MIAPANVEDCFYMAIEAVNIARKYSVPVIFLTRPGHRHAHRGVSCEPDLEKVCQDITPDFTPVPTHKPYDLAAKDGITQHVKPGTQILDGIYPIATGLEHDEYGHPTGSPKLHMQMTAKRRKKLQALGATLPLPKIYGPPEGNVLLVGWGSTEGPNREAVDRSRAAGDSVSSIHLRHINPLPNGLENIFSGFNHIFVVEMNDEGLYGYGQLGARAARPLIATPRSRASTRPTASLGRSRKSSKASKPNCANNPIAFPIFMSQTLTENPVVDPQRARLPATGERKGADPKRNRRRPSDLVSRLRRFLGAGAVFQAD